MLANDCIVIWVLRTSEVEVYRLEGHVHGVEAWDIGLWPQVMFHWRLGQMCGEELN
jgi:hypothetical protein